MKDFIVKYWIEVLFGFIVSGLALAYKKLSCRIKRQGTIELGIQSLLRDRIIQTYNHYIKEECCPIYALENVEDLYTAYHALGGNGTVTKLVEKLRELPTEPKDKEVIT